MVEAPTVDQRIAVGDALTVALTVARVGFTLIHTVVR
jgi:hypothetical protein